VHCACYVPYGTLAYRIQQLVSNPIECNKGPIWVETVRDRLSIEIIKDCRLRKSESIWCQTATAKGRGWLPRAPSGSHRGAGKTWTPAFAGVTMPSQRLVIAAKAAIHLDCGMQRPALTGPYWLPWGVDFRLIRHYTVHTSQTPVTVPMTGPGQGRCREGHCRSRSCREPDRL